MMQQSRPSVFRKPCDVWELGVDGRGVAVHRVRVDGRLRTQNAVRLFWELTHSACLLPSTVLIMQCGNKRCVEPSHALVLTRQQAARRPRRSRYDVSQQRCVCQPPGLWKGPAQGHRAMPIKPSSSS